jgi:thiazole synthase
MPEDLLRIGATSLGSRLIVGTGKYPDPDVGRRAIEASGAQMVTVAVRRIPLSERGPGTVLGALDWTRLTLLPNTAGCATAGDAIRTALLAREAGGGDLVKLEVIGDPRTLMPDVVALLEAASALVREGMTVLPYTTDDLVLARRLQDIGCAAVMPLGAPIGSGLGIQNPHQMRLLREAVTVPLIVDAGVGTASDAALAMELGADGVLMNTGIACARDPVRMAEAMREAVSAGRKAFLAGRIPRKAHASASSPPEGMIE